MFSYPAAYTEGMLKNEVTAMDIDDMIFGDYDPGPSDR